jgi:hypothetical protein
VDALALWQVSSAGAAAGAWVVSQDEAFSSREAARRLLIGLERRAITAMHPAQVDGIVEKLSAAAGVDAERWWSSYVFSPVDAFGELVARRAAYDATVAKARESGKNAAALEWARDFPADATPDGFEGLRELSGLGTAAGAPVVSEVLTVSRVLKWLVGVWAETEQVKNRRPYDHLTLAYASTVPVGAGVERLPIEVRWPSCGLNRCARPAWRARSSKRAHTAWAPSST